ncbi:unnamed protein product [Victoria cruziana]
MLFLALLLLIAVAFARNVVENQNANDATTDACNCASGHTCCSGGFCCSSNEYCCDYDCCSYQEYAEFLKAHGVPHN